MVACFSQLLMNVDPASLYLGSCFMFESTVKNAVAVMVVNDQQVSVAARGAMGEASRQIVVSGGFWHKRLGSCTGCKCFNVL